MRRRTGLLLVAALAAPGLGVVVWIRTPLPPDLADPASIQSVTLQDRSGIVLRTTRARDGTRGGWVPLAELDPKLLSAFLALEDRRFQRHRGVDLWAIARAMRDNVRAGRVVAGGSTITMQTARLVRGTTHSLGAKVAQILWALRLETHLDKQAILEQYLNRVPLGQGTSGVGAAAELYFQSDARALSWGQAALLAGLAHAPARDNPLADPERARARRALALRRLVMLGYLADREAARAAAEPVVVRPRGAPFLAPHFTTRVLQWAGAEGHPFDGTWVASLDLGLQKELEAEVRHTVDVLRERTVTHAAAVVLDNRTGELLAWVGSPDFLADTGGQVDMVVSPRQPGSALKPFLYGLAFDRGYTAASVLPDVPTAFPTATGTYRPRNYDRTFHGPVRAREALASSYNVPAVELAHRVGPGSLLHALRRAGFESLRRSPEYYGLGLALGNGDVTLLELANAYRALANGGAWRPYSWRRGGDSPRGDRERRVMSPAAAALVLDLLRDPVARIPGFGRNTPLDFPFPAAAKTGTSRHFTDNWAVVTTQGFTVAVWVGNFSGRPMQGVGGITGAGPLLHRAALRVARRYPPGAVTEPWEHGAIQHRVCRLSGRDPTRYCPVTTEWFLPGTRPDGSCDWHGPDGVTLPTEYAEWQAREARMTMR
jgi:penicillin-binding protein 1C